MRQARKSLTRLSWNKTQTSFRFVYIKFSQYKFFQKRFVSCKHLYLDYLLCENNLLRFLAETQEEMEFRKFSILSRQNPFFLGRSQRLTGYNIALFSFCSEFFFLRFLEETKIRHSFQISVLWKRSPSFLCRDWKRFDMASLYVLTRTTVWAHSSC